MLKLDRVLEWLASNKAAVGVCTLAILAGALIQFGFNHNEPEPAFLQLPRELDRKVSIWALKIAAGSVALSLLGAAIYAFRCMRKGGGN